MKLLFKKLLSLHEDGAVCYFLILDEQFTILLDCGINHSFDFSKYRQVAAELSNVQLVLISHSTLQYSGAYPFLISEMGLSPKIFYTTQPIMRYCPLNIHEEILNLRLPNYNKKIFNKIYTYFEEMQLLKPYQKKQLELVSKQKVKTEDQNVALKQPLKSIQFCCYLAGSTLGSLYWRISYGLINIVYLVQYNNYSLYHIDGLDFDNITSQTTHLLITDVYPHNYIIKQKDVYQEIKQTLLNFYRQNYIEPNKPKVFNAEHDQKMIIACYPNELIAEVLIILRKIVEQLQEGINIEKIGAIHLSKRFLQLIKSQSQYFTNDFKIILQKVNEYFQQSIKVENRINVCSMNSLPGILSSAKNVQVYYVGAENYRPKTEKNQITANLRSMKIFDEDEEKLLRSAGKLSASKLESKMEDQAKIQEEIASIEAEGQKEKQNLDNHQEVSVDDEFQNKNQRNIINKYIAIQSGIPRFNLNRRQKDQQMTEFGLRHHAGQDVRPVRQTIYEYKTNLTSQNFQEMMMSKKQSKIQVMNIEFSLPQQEANTPIKYQKLNLSSKSFHLTEYQSSLRVIHSIKPKDIIFINTPRQSTQLVNNYQNNLNQISEFHKFQIYDSNVKKLCYLSYNNELLEYKMNYLPQMQQNKVQRVKGTIQKRDNILHIHLDCLEDKEIASFRLEKFYSRLCEKMSCRFIGFGIEVQGIKIYRKDNIIVLEGEYSEEFFKVRKELYTFLGIR